MNQVVSWIMPKIGYGFSRDNQGVKVKGFLQTTLRSPWRTQPLGLLPVYELSDLYILRPGLRERGTVCGLGYRIKRLVDTLTPSDYRYWRCLSRLRIDQWPIATLIALAQAQVSKWGEHVLWAVGQREEINSRVRSMRSEHREFVNNLVTEQQNNLKLESEWLNYEYDKQELEPNCRDEWIEQVCITSPGDPNTEPPRELYPQLYPQLPGEPTTYTPRINPKYRPEKPNGYPNRFTNTFPAWYPGVLRFDARVSSVYTGKKCVRAHAAPKFT